MGIERVIIISLVVVFLILLITLLLTAGILMFFGVLAAIGGLIVAIRKKAYLEDVENTPPGRESLYIEGRSAVWIGAIMSIIGTVLIGVQTALWLR
jgi:hypothetical protein